ncbi:integrator complex subunit 2-like isoform X2 [Haliotis rufescens]|uniref:integrator complex subunit 2-like isoform X2 n=1 Tax=Haliotis rufescens TaxID=6454 RepID=UPI00201E8DEC|nr:integrator complex subunit 2-like isoform X2 [Haliotis rufescens]
MNDLKTIMSGRKKHRSPVKCAVFQAMQSVDIDSLSECSESDIRPVLVSLVRMALCSPLETSDSWTKARKDVLKILSGLDVVNSIVALLSIDFHALEQDVKKEQQLRAKLGGNQGDSVLVSQLHHGLALEFERSDAPRRIRLLLSELLYIMSEIKEQSKGGNYQKQSELFESEVYLEEVCDVLCIAQAELPNLLPMTELAEALLCVKNGAWLLCQLVSNSPQCFMTVCSSLVSRGERVDEETLGGRQRLEMLRMLCTINPKEALNVRRMCIQHCTMPGLAIALTLQVAEVSHSEEELVSFVSCLLLGNDQAVRLWFSQFIKAGQKRKREPSGCMLYTLRQQLLDQVTSIVPATRGDKMAESGVIQASMLIRLYCALRGMATLKYSDEEMVALLDLVTARPPPSKAGAHFISLGLCTLIACPYLLGSLDQEQQVIDWIKWLMTNESIFEKEAASGTSFGEMLFLIALHFHNNQIHAIADLVCKTLGMKSAVKANALSRMRQIFTQELFTEQVIASHAVKIPVTPNLNATMSGYLPLHSICQLLKSRVFSKHKVAIKDWIYKQILHSSLPLHPLLPQLIETYVNSIIVKGAKTEHTNEPLTEQEILAVYRDSVTHKQSAKQRQQSPSDIRQDNLSPQLLVLYYVLLYEDTLMNHMKTIVLLKSPIKSYSDTIMSKIPINYLIQAALKEQQMYAGLFAPLTRLLVTQYPHLCLVEDWLEESLTTQQQQQMNKSKVVHSFSPSTYQEALSELQSSPTKVIAHLEHLLSLPSLELMPYNDVLISSLPTLLLEGTPRRVLDLAKKNWFKAHAVSPRSIRLMTVNALRAKTHGVFQVMPHTEQDIVVDPLIVLRCDCRVFRNPSILEIVLRILSAYTQACQVYLTNHIQTHPILDNNLHAEHERQDLKIALSAAQESAIIQILLECCHVDKEETPTGQLSDLREVQCLIFSHLHQVFIADPNLAKLVHFQGYASELIPLLVAGVPSMHICLDFIPELLGQPQTEKQVFSIKLLSHLCCQYSLPKSLSVAKLGINVMFTMLTVLESEMRVLFFQETVPCLFNICKAFPPLCDDVTSLLTQIGRVCFSQLTTTNSEVASGKCLMMSYLTQIRRVCFSQLTTTNSVVASDFSLLPGEDGHLDMPEPTCKRQRVGVVSSYSQLYNTVQQTFQQLASQAVVTNSIF